MCTATYVPIESSFLFGANRDEHLKRKNALPPQFTRINDKQALYPVDGEKGGTWVGILENCLMACLLNGAFEPYTPQPPYRKSRGLIIPELFKYGDPESFLQNTDFTGIEPFTLLMMPNAHSGQQICELRWDGRQKHVQYLAPNKPHIWASSPLNPEALLEKKTGWFQEWLEKNNSPDMQALKAFHHKTDPDQPAEGILMKTDHQVQTVSVTLVERKNDEAKMVYEDLRENRQSEQKLPLNCDVK